MTEPKSLALAASPSSPLIPTSLVEAEALATTLSKSALLPDHFKGKVADVFWAISLGLEVGLPPVAALSSVYVVHGKPGLYADAMVALVLRSGLAHYFRCASSSDTEATYETHRIGDPEPRRVTITMAEAERAGWAKQNQKYQSEPRRMLEARAKSWLAKDKFPDVLRGIASVEELRDEGEAFRAPTSVARTAIDAVAHEAAPPKAPAGMSVDELVAAFAAAPTLEALDEVAARAKGTSGAERDRLKAAYGARLKDLTAGRVAGSAA
jgi:hypothetical protein